MGSIKPNKTRASSLLNLVIAFIILRTVALLSCGIQLKILADIRDSSHYWEGIRYFVLSQGILFILVNLIAILTIVFFTMWFRRAYYNLRFINDKLEHKDGWAVAIWFIPVANLFYPFKLMNETFAFTRQYLSGQAIHYHAGRQKRILVAWWMLWVLANFVNYSVIAFAFGKKDINAMITSTYFEMVASTLMVCTAFLLIRVVKTYGAMEQELYNIKIEDDGNISRHLAAEINTL